MVVPGDEGGTRTHTSTAQRRLPAPPDLFADELIAADDLPHLVLFVLLEALFGPDLSGDERPGMSAGALPSP